MKVLHFGPSLKHGGGIASVISDIICENESHSQIVTQRGNSFISDFIFLIFSCLKLLLYRNKYHYHVHTVLGKYDIFRLLLIYLILKNRSTFFSIHLHNARLEGLLENTYPLLSKLVLKSSDNIFVLNLKTQEVLLRSYGVNSIVVSNPILKLKETAIIKQNVILFVGTISNRKGIRTFIDAISKLMEENLLVNWRVIVIGERGDYLDDFPLGFEYLGGLERKDVIQHLRVSKALVLSSNAEGQPVVVLEALSNYCIPLVTPVGAMSRFLHKDIDPRIVHNVEDVNSLCISLKAVIDGDISLDFPKAIEIYREVPDVNSILKTLYS